MRFEYDDLEGTCSAGPQRASPFAKPVSREGKPIRVILELTTLLEGFTGAMAVICLAGAIFSILLAMGDSGADATREWRWALWSGIGFFIFYPIWASTNCFYVIDGRQRKLLYHFQVLGFSNERVVASFPDITTIAVDAVERYSKPKRGWGHYYWVYKTVIVLQDGSRICVSNETLRQSSLHEDGRKAAEVVGCLFNPEGKSTPYSIFNF